MANGVVRASGYVTPIKTRILAGGVHSAKQQVVRIDRAGGKAGPTVLRQFDRALARSVARADAVILSDYGTGVLTPERWARVVTDAKRRRPALVFVDSRYHLDGFEGMTASDHVKQLHAMGETVYPYLKARWEKQDSEPCEARSGEGGDENGACREGEARRP